LVSVLVTRQERSDRVRLCGWLVDVYCLGKRRGRPMRHGRTPAADFRSLFFAAYQARSIAAPLELAQQLVFGAVEYARALGSGLGLGPARGVAATTDQTEVVGGPSAISFGCDGKPSFVQGPPDNADAVPQTLERPSGAATSPSWSRHSRKRRRRLRRANSSPVGLRGTHAISGPVLAERRTDRPRGYARPHGLRQETPP
jgi:hypothetical protein